MDRDSELDFNRGIAIILVVLGHSIQSNYSSFDENFAFRIIYSFHMPYFIFLSGWSARFALVRIYSAKSFSALIRISFRRFTRLSLSLLVPFFVWSLWLFLFEIRGVSIFSFARKVLVNPDYSLWYLPCLFWCSVFLLLATLALWIFFKMIHQCPPFFVVSALALVVWYSTRSQFPKWFGLEYANFFHGGLFLFFALGACYPDVRNLSFVLKKISWCLSVLFFALLAPFWSRTGQYALITSAPWFLHNHLIATLFRLVVPVSGILVFLGLGSVYRIFPVGLQNVMIFLGLNTLGIYALQRYFLNWDPFFMAPLTISLILTNAFSQIPFVKLLFFGKLGELRFRRIKRLIS